METTELNKEYITIKVPKSIGAVGIKRLKEYVHFLEINKDLPKIKVSKKTINELSREINKNAWEKLKKKRYL